MAEEAWRWYRAGKNSPQQWSTVLDPSYRRGRSNPGLISYGPNLVAIERRAAEYVDRIFKGTKPADLPVEQPTKIEMLINMKTAKTLGVTIPQSVLLRADEVLE
jgi:ABC transporter substrate binding protein